MTTPTFCTKLARVLSEVAYVQKDATNEFSKYSYATAAAVLQKVNAAIAEQGMCLSNTAELLHYIPPSDKGSTRAVVRLTLTVTDGQNTAAFQGIGEGSDKGDKAVMKANTAALKYAVAAGLLISWGDDPEADASTDRDAYRKEK